MLTYLNRFLFYFPEEHHKQLDQDEIIEISDQDKGLDPEWHEEIVNANIDIIEISYLESVLYFKRLFQAFGDLGEVLEHQWSMSGYTTSRK
jgi:hypothetical protein